MKKLSFYKSPHCEPWTRRCEHCRDEGIDGERTRAGFAEHFLFDPAAECKRKEKVPWGYKFVPSAATPAAPVVPAAPCLPCEKKNRDPQPRPWAEVEAELEAELRAQWAAEEKAKGDEIPHQTP